MMGAIGKWIDWSAVQLDSLMSPVVDAADPRLPEAIALLNGPNFISPESNPAQLLFDDAEHFHFPSPRPGEFAENNIVCGQLYRCTANWQARPVIVLLHGGDIMRGGSASLAYRRFPRIARLCNQADFSAIRIMEPCHFDRHPRQVGALADLNYLRMAEIFFAQGVADIRALVGWLLNEGVQAVALWGVSYGGWLAGLTACYDRRLTAAVLTVPGVCMNHLTLQAEQIVWRRRRELLGRRKPAYQALDATPLSLLNSHPVIPMENILLIEGTYDRIAVSQPIEALRQAWSPVECWHLPHSHLSWMAAPNIPTRVLRWLTPKLEAGQKNNA